MKKLVASSILSLVVSPFIFGQQVETFDPTEQKKCATYTELHKIFEMYPEVEQEYYANELLYNSMVISSDSKKADTSYIIPVVVHILHEYGAENISDSRVYDLMEVLNREFNAADPDSVDLVPEYQNLHGNGKMEFRLASIDPFGNCTNGIEHIWTHETNIGDAFSKVNQWNRARYMNIWVVDVVGTPGAAAYATPPGSVDGSGFWLDGVLSQYSYVGDTPGIESVITHEVGHFFNLKHVWGDLDLINNPPSICGDDGVEDTPVTMGWLAPCPMGIYPNGWKVCDSTIVEDVQNYMEYSYCDRHFTPGQVERMHNALQAITGQRDMLWKDSTLMATGVLNLQMPQVPTNDLNNLTVPLCAPVADFYADDKIACVGTLVSFSDESWNAVVGSREWTFEGGTPATATTANVNVSWSTPGYKKVTLTVTNAAGSDTKTVDKYLYIAPPWSDLPAGPQTVDIEGNQHYLFVIDNPENNYGTFIPVSGVGYNNSKCFKLQNFKDISNAAPYTADWFYNNRLGKSVDNLITPAFDLSNTTNVQVKFKFAYATNATDVADITEKLKVWSTRNCGASWSPTILTVDGTPSGNTITGANLVTGGFAGNTDFNPSNNNMWSEVTFNYSANSSDVNTRFRFEFEASDFANNLFIDQIEVTGVLGISESSLNDMELVVYPNPTNGEAINVSYYAQNEATTFTLRDVQGKIIAEQVIETTNSQVTTELNNTSNLASGCYFLEVTAGGHSMTQKVVVL